jgi:hypothetical protein
MVSTDNTTLPEYILLSLEAKRRGYKSTLAFRRWCQNKRVPYITDGKKKWVRPASVDSVEDGLHAVDMLIGDHELPRRDRLAQIARVALAGMLACDAAKGGDT